MTENRPQLLLASASPRRRELLEQIGIRFQWLPVSVDETARDREPPLALAERLARDKARAGHAARVDLPVLGADTIVVIGRRILGKPAGEDQAIEQLRQLSGRSHRVLSAVALCTPKGRCLSSVSISRVRFRVLDPGECRSYAASGEPFDKAGGYAIQGRAATWIEHIEGSYSGIMGLPLFETARLLNLAGIPVFQR